MTHISPVRRWPYLQERALVDPILDLVTTGSLWVADRNFCFQRFLLGIAVRSWGSSFRHRPRTCEPSTTNCQVSLRASVVRAKPGRFFQQAIVIEDEGRR